MDLPKIRIGTVDYMPAYIQSKDRYLGTFIMGKSGTGKSTAISNMWQQDCLYKSAKVLIEPSGFLASDCYAISRGKAKYCSLDTPVSINPMQAPYPPQVISDLVAEAINQVIKMTTPNLDLTVKMRAILDESVKWCIGNGRLNLLNVRDNIANMRGSGETRDGIVQRLNFILNDERLERVLCGNKPVIWSKLISKGQSFILDCFGMSKEKMVFAGTLVTQQIKNYFRYERPKEYKPLALYIDEAHNFVNPNFFDILKEGRKYKIAATLATQDLVSVKDNTIRYLLLNVGNIIAMRLGAVDAANVAREMHIKPEDLQFIEKLHLYYLTPQERGIAKAIRPPFFRKMEPKRAGRAREPFNAWFPTVSYC